MGGSFAQSGHDQPHATFALCQTEPALYFHTLTLIPVILSLVPGFALLGATQCRTGESDSVLLAITEILTVSVDPVRQDTAGIMPFPLPEPFCHLLQIPSFIVGIKGAAFQPSPPIHNTDVQLRPKLHRLSRFSPHNGTDEGLAHTDDPVRHAVGAVIVHVLLLLIDGTDRIQTFCLACGQRFSKR